MSEKPSISEIQDAVRKKYAEISQTSEGKFAFLTGMEGAEALGYDLNVLSDLPPEVMKSFCGVGNPFVLGAIEKGESVLDIGCGAGFDLIVASRRVGPSGRVCGIDITPEMADRARENLALAGADNIEIKLAGSESIPFDSSTFDVVISNGVLNLSPQKERSFQEIYRVIKPGGRLQFADVVLNADMSSEIPGTLEAWCD
jgi:SAM-dependent methyltransferase